LELILTSALIKKERSIPNGWKNKKFKPAWKGIPFKPAFLFHVKRGRLAPPFITISDALQDQ
jgi:hypothetical protein